MAVSKYDIQLDLDKTPGTSHAHLVELVGSNKRVLDVGCDTGYLGEALGAFGNTTSGFEINEETAREARKRLARVEVGDLETSDLVELFGRASFDVVIFGDVLEHLRDPLPVLRQARGLLAPGGSVLISTPNVAHGDIRLALLAGRFRYTRLGILDATHTRFFTRDSLVEFLADAGFVLIELRRTHAPLFGTETEVAEADFDPALVARLREDPEATTYQFVARAVPDDQAQVSAAQALRVDALEQEKAALTARVSELSSSLAAREDELQALRSLLAGVEAERSAAEENQRHAVAALEAQRDALRTELRAVHTSTTWRAGRVLVAPLARLRGPRPPR